jgi:PAS domain S-box-containing protein
MNAYLLLPLVQAIFGLVLAVVVLKGQPKRFVNRLFCIFLLCISLWGIFIFAMRASPDVEHAYFWQKWSLLPLGPFMGVLGFHFGVRYTGTKVKPWLFRLLYLICVLLIPLEITGHVFSGVQMKWYGYAPILGDMAPLWLLFSFLMSPLTLAVLVRASIKSADPEQKNRLIYIIIGLLFSLFGGFFDFLPVFGLPAYPGAIIGTIIFCLLATVSIVKYHLLDIRFVLRKSIAYLFTSAIVAIPFVGFFLLVNYVFTRGRFPLAGYLAVAVILALTWQPLWAKVQLGVDRLFYRERYNYLRALDSFSWHTQSILDQAKLGRTMVNLIAGALRTESVHLLQPVAPDDDFSITYSTEIDNCNLHIQLGKQSALIRWLTHSDDSLLCQEIGLIPQLQAISDSDQKNLQKMKAFIIAPLKTRLGHLSGLLVLGQKLSEQNYTVEDKQLLRTVSSQMAIVLENVRLYEQLRMSEEALRGKEREYRELAESINDVFFAMDDELKCIYWNKTIEGITGICARDALGKSFYDLFPDSEWRKRAEGIFCEVLRMREPRRYVSDNAIGGKSFVWEINAYPAKNGLTVIANDITESRRAEEKEEQLQQELDHANRLASIGELAAGVAHELNNPLTGIIGFSQRLLRKSTNESTKQDLQRVYEEACRAAKVVENLRTFARRSKPRKELINVNDVVRKALEMRMYELKSDNIEILTELDDSLPEIMADFQQMQQVFLNLIVNAEQAVTETNNRGKLIIKTETQQDCVRVLFTDNGPGIAADNFAKLFQPFFTTRSEKGGTGLGLSICHGIVAGHGGKIYARNNTDKGVAFFVELPLEKVGIVQTVLRPSSEWPPITSSS